MPQFAVEFHPLAADEAQAAERWYRERNETASGRFQRELDRAIERISERPEAGSPYLGNTRRGLLRRFPFFVVYRVRDDDFKSSPSRMRGDGRDTGGRVDRRLRWLEMPSLRRTPHVVRSLTATSSRQSSQGLDLRWRPPVSREALHDRNRGGAVDKAGDN